MSSGPRRPSPAIKLGIRLMRGGAESGASPTLIPKTFDITIEGDQRLGLLVDWSMAALAEGARRACCALSRSASRGACRSRAASPSPSLSPLDRGHACVVRVPRPRRQRPAGEEARPTCAPPCAGRSDPRGRRQRAESPDDGYRPAPRARACRARRHTHVHAAARPQSHAARAGAGARPPARVATTGPAASRQARWTAAARRRAAPAAAAPRVKEEAHLHREVVGSEGRRRRRGCRRGPSVSTFRSRGPRCSRRSASSRACVFEKVFKGARPGRRRAAPSAGRGSGKDGVVEPAVASPTTTCAPRSRSSIGFARVSGPRTRQRARRRRRHQQCQRRRVSKKRRRPSRPRPPRRPTVT